MEQAYMYLRHMFGMKWLYSLNLSILHYRKDYKHFLKRNNLLGKMRNKKIALISNKYQRRRQCIELLRWK